MFNGNAAWNLRFIQKSRKIKYGIIPHIDKEFFGTGILKSINCA